MGSKGDGMGWDGYEWNGMGWDGVEWDGMAWHGVGWGGIDGENGFNVFFRVFFLESKFYGDMSVSIYLVCILEHVCLEN